MKSSDVLFVQKCWKWGTLLIFAVLAALGISALIVACNPA